MVATAWLFAQLLLVRAAALAGGPGADGVVEGPEPEDVKAGWTAFALFLLLALAVAILARSLVTQLRKAQRAADAGVYGDPAQGTHEGTHEGHEGPHGAPDDGRETRPGRQPDTRDGEQPGD